MTHPTEYEHICFWHEYVAFQRSAFGRSTAGNYVVATIFFSSVFSVFPVPPSGPFLIEGVLGSKNLFSEMPKNLGVDTFPDPVGHFGAPGGHFGFRGL